LEFKKLKAGLLSLSIIYGFYCFNLFARNPTLANMFYFARRLFPIAFYSLTIFPRLTQYFGYASLIGNFGFLVYFANSWIHGYRWFMYKGYNWFNDIGLEYTLFYYTLFLISYHANRDVGKSFNLSIQAVATLSWIYEIPYFFNWGMILHSTHPLLINSQILATIFLILLVTEYKFKTNPLIPVFLVNYILFTLAVPLIGKHSLNQLIPRIPSFLLLSSIVYGVKHDP